MAAGSVNDLNRRGIALLLALVLCFNLAAAAFAEETCEHSYVPTEYRQEPTCTDYGFTAYRCSLCGDIQPWDVKEPLGHDWGEGVVVQEATAETEGAIGYRCSRCGEVKWEAIPVKSAGPAPAAETAPGEQDLSPMLSSEGNDPDSPPVPDTSVDLEGAPIWERPFQELMLSGDYAQDFLTVVRTQMWYTESEDNFEPVWNSAENRWDKNGYTRYGAWYGLPYGDWCAMFLSFCLKYASVPQDVFPWESSSENWAAALAERGLFGAKGSYLPKPGDLIFFDLDGNTYSDHCGVVCQVDAAARMVYTVEGNRTPEVRPFEYSLYDTSITGYGILPVNPDPQPHLALEPLPEKDKTEAESEKTDGEKSEEEGEDAETPEQEAGKEASSGSFVPEEALPDGTSLVVLPVEEVDANVAEIVRAFASGPLHAAPEEILLTAYTVGLLLPDGTFSRIGAEVTLNTDLPLPALAPEGGEESSPASVKDIIAVYALDDGLHDLPAQAVSENGTITSVTFRVPEAATFAICYTCRPADETPAEAEEEPEKEAEESFEEIIAFDETVEVAAGSINVTAGEGVLPEGAVLTVSDAPLMLRAAKRMAAPAQVSEEESDAPESIEESTAEADAEVVIASYRYEISLQDAEGNALQPKDGGSVTLRFALPEGANPNLYARVIHMTDEGPEILHTEKEGNTVVALSDGFSLYTVEFYYEKKQYVLNGDSSAPLSEVLAEIGLSGEVEAVSVSNEELFGVERDSETGVWLVTALQPFDTQERMTVTIGGIGYEIIVLDALKPVDYWDPLTGSHRTCDSYRFLTGSGVLENGWYVVNQTTSYSKAISIRGSVNIILGNDVTLTAGGGICVPSGDNAKLTVWAQTDSSRAGRLIAKPKKGCAIGGVKSVPAGEIVINGGYIEAVGADGCAAIGGADGKSGYQSITINGGDITATGGYNAAGIGGGDEATGTLGPVTINGGSVKASGTNHGAGIGGGDRRGCGPVTINGGTIEAVGGTWDDGGFTTNGSGAGIGGGLYAAQGGKVTINGGSVKAVGGIDAAGIGGGSGDVFARSSVGGEVLITGGTVEARTPGGGAAIGGGEYCSAGNIVITGGTVDAGFIGEQVSIDSQRGCGIGSGHNTKEDSGSVKITGGTVTATGNNCAGIGGVRTVEITGGDVAAVSAYAAGIGGSYYRKNVCNVTIGGGNVIASSIAGGAGIGSGLFGENAGASVTITGGKVWAFGHTRYINIWKETVGSAAAGNSMKWAKMHDKTMTGGNIASLFGSIGDGLMMLIFQGIYSGKYCGAGIGGGYKDNGCPVTITGGEVFAAASKSGASAIGRGLSGKKDGTLSLGNHLAVLSGNDPKKLEWKTALERISACQQSLAAYIEPCEHEFKYTDLDAVYHRAGTCKYCADRISAEKQTHVFDGKTHTCICGHAEVKLTLKKTYLNVDVHVRDDLNGQERYLEPDQPVYISEDAAFTIRAEAKDRNKIPIITVSHQGSGGGKTVLTPESASQLTENGLITDIHTYRMTEINSDSGVTLEVDYENACKVSFSPGDAGVIAGVYDMPPVYVPANRTYTVPACEYEKSPELKDKAFQGWKLTGGSVREEIKPLFKPGDPVTPLSDLAFEAQWDSEVMAYPLWVNGTHVTEQNKDDVLGDGSGSIRYVPDNETPGGILTLNNPRPFTGGTGDSQDRVALIYAEGINLTVKGTGTVASAVKGNEIGILVSGGKLTLGGFLTIDASSYGVYADNGIDFRSLDGKNTVIIVRGGWNPAVAVKTEGTITISSDLGIVTPAGGKSGGTTVLDASGSDAKKVEIMSSLVFRFYPNSGTGAVQKVTVPAGRPYTLPECTFTPPAGYTFRCWNIDNEEYTNGHTLSVEELNKHSQKGNIYATAIWEKQGYTLKEWEWQEESEPPTAKAVFVVAGGGEEKMAATVTKGKTEEATCTEAGSTVYTAKVTYYGATYTDSHTKTLPATGHTAGTAVRENEKAPSCIEAGSYDLVTRCSQCDIELKRTHEEESALGHAWSEWKDRVGGTTQYRECSRCHKEEEKGAETCSHKMILEAEIPATCTERGVREHYRCTVCMGIFEDAEGKTEWFYENVTIPAKGHTSGEPEKQNEKAPTCTESGSYEEVVRCTICQEEISREVKTGKPALSHDYGEPKWIWTDDNSEAQAVFVCRRDPSHRYTVNAGVTETRVAPGCEKAGSILHTATVGFEGKVYTNSKTEAVPAAGHTADEPQEENVKDPTCTKAGSCDMVTRCSQCGAELQRTHQAKKALGHAWSPWTDEPGGTAQYRVCTRCELRETRGSVPCSHEGSMRSEPAVAPTCTEQGHTAFYHCTACMGIYADANGTQELSYEDLVLPPAHTPGEPVNENEKAPTCTEAGSYEEVVRCSVCGEILSREAKTGESAIGHDYGEAKWVWADDCSAAQAVFVCRRDPAHRKMVNAGITEEKTEATCTEAGSIVYTASASFEGKTCTDSKTKTVPATSHTAGTAVKENEKAATCTEKGSYDLVTHCSSCGAELKRTHAEEKALGHAWSEWKHGETADYRECTRCKLKESKGSKTCDHLMVIEPAVEPTCTAQGHKAFYHCAKCMGIYADKDGNQELLYEHVILPAKGHTAGVPSRQNEQPATCTESGTYEEIISCTVCGEILSSEIRTGEPALGHDYVLSAWDWAEDYTAEAIFICRRNPSHQVAVSADVSVERVEPTCISEGRETYIATVNFEGTIYKDEESKTLKKTGHIPGPAVKEHDGHPDATCTEDGSYEEVVSCSYCGQELSRTFVQEKAFGHDWEQITEDGERYLYCKNCQEKIPIPSHEHNSNLEHINKTDATCTQQGYSRDFYRCKYCMELFSDAAGTYPLSDAELRNLVIPALGHEGGSPEKINIQSASCTQPGSYDEAVYCTRCGSLLSLTHCDDAVKPLGHDYGEPVWNWTDDNSAATATFTCSRDAGHRMTEQADIVVTRMEPGCVEDGWMHVFASVWRNGILYYDEKLAGLPKTGHKEAPPVRINIVQAGCETAGSYDEAVYCEHCGQLRSSSHHENAVPPLGHLWSEWARQGDKLMRTCSRCEAVQEIGEAPHVHQMKPDPGREATCIETGVTPGFVCTVCGGHFADVDGTQEAEILPLKAHTPGEVEIEFDPEDLNGYYECVYCTVCGTMLSLDWVDEEHYLGYYYSDTTRVWVKGSGMPATFTVKRSEQDQKTYDLFQYISVDGATVDRRFYTRASGSLILTLLPDYLETLSLGRHTLTTVFYDGQASTDFVVIAPGSGSGNYSGSGTIDYIYNPQAKTVSNNPRTGDDSRLALWGILAAVSAAGVVVLTAKKRKRREN